MKSKIKELYVTFTLKLNWMLAWLRHLLLYGFWMLAWLRNLLLHGLMLVSTFWLIFHLIFFVGDPLVDIIRDWLITAETHNSYSSGSKEFLPTIAVHLESQWNISFELLGVREMLDWIPFLVIPMLIAGLTATYLDELDEIGYPSMALVRRTSVSVVRRWMNKLSGWERLWLVIFIATFIWALILGVQDEKIGHDWFWLWAVIMPFVYLVGLTIRWVIEGFKGHD